MTLPTPSSAWTRPAAPGWPTSVASTVVPVWVAPKSGADQQLRHAQDDEDRREQPAGGQVGAVAAADAWRSRCSANAVPKTASSAAASSRAPLGDTATTPRPTRAGPIAKDASSAAPS